jgi:hypothetical protein
VASPYRLVFADAAARDQYFQVANDVLELLFWLLNDDPQPNWRETYPIWELTRYGDTPSHVAWKLWDGYLHSILYTIDEDERVAIIRWASVVRYEATVP